MFAKEMFARLMGGTTAASICSQAGSLARRSAWPESSLERMMSATFSLRLFGLFVRRGQLP
ncbi:hypothetical protein ASF06_09215 [Agreia sp. Leaf244]|nr:hypothetical protein ASF06_09215 [Agreia sp. Leaf244]